MTDTEMRIALQEAVRSMGIARTAGARADWARAEQALLAAQEHNMILLREIGLKLLIELPDDGAERRREAAMV